MYFENLAMLPINTNFKITSKCSYSMNAHSSDDPGPWLLSLLAGPPMPEAN